jgi:uncharacterized protein YodC (DUF2158 family)
MPDEIKEGSTVQLNSGGPRMTVTTIKDGGKMAICTWFDSSGKRDSSAFPVSALTSAEGY